MKKEPCYRPSSEDLLEEPYISNCIKSFIQNSVKNSHTPVQIAALINSVAAIDGDDLFGEFDDRSTLRSQGSQRSTLRSQGSERSTLRTQGSERSTLSSEDFQ